MVHNSLKIAANSLNKCHFLSLKEAFNRLIFVLYLLITSTRHEQQKKHIIFKTSDIANHYHFGNS